MTGSDHEPRIVVGIDGSEESKNALRWAKRMAEATGAALDAISAWEIVSEYGWSALPPYEPQEVEKALESTVDEVFGAERPANLRLYTQAGSPAEVLIEASKSALMVVVGCRGRGGFTGLLLGSVSAKVAEHAICPVLVVHGTQAAAAAA